ncbi:MAG: zinc ribbon domain-containing protein [Candidatus Sericytochromatia bacterium]|nr:zinc ribbon domain-containing protein [Candidatus Sericytochromatia bacterium]
MAEPDLKLDSPCPRCGTPHPLQARRCRHCYHDLSVRMERSNPNPLLEFARPLVVCEACGKSNPFSSDVCLECGGDMIPAQEAGVAPGADASALLSGKPRAGRQRRRAATAAVGRHLSIALLMRVAALGFLFWGVVDTSVWLTRTNETLAPGNPAALQYTVFAVYELIRNASLVLGVWLLTSLGGRRPG